MFNKDSEKVVGFVITCKLYIRMRIRKEMVKEQVNWIWTYVTYVQRELANMWKENILVDLELEDWKFLLIELLVILKREFGRIDNKSAKVAELK